MLDLNNRTTKPLLTLSCLCTEN